MDLLRFLLATNFTLPFGHWFSSTNYWVSFRTHRFVLLYEKRVFPQVFFLIHRQKKRHQQNFSSSFRTHSGTPRTIFTCFWFWAHQHCLCERTSENRICLTRIRWNLPIVLFRRFFFMTFKGFFGSCLRCSYRGLPTSLLTSLSIFCGYLRS